MFFVFDNLNNLCPSFVFANNLETAKKALAKEKRIDRADLKNHFVLRLSLKMPVSTKKGE